ncbi:MAG: hypothetical protein EHM33_30195 [Chloroflexi bacterium]|nr:MAG: hypothetical protein EHM33_30195 [Chloroflexota bacterium]
MIITDEMLSNALAAYWRENDGTGQHSIAMRAALEAIAPMLIARGMQEAAEVANDWEVGGSSVRILARAQELDPQ